MRDDIVALTLWAEIGLLLYALVTAQWGFALQYTGIFVLTVGWLYFEAVVLEKRPTAAKRRMPK